MIRILLKLLGGLALILVLLLAAGYYLLRDPNRFKPEIEAYIAEQTGARVDLGTDLAWQLLPPLAISATGVSAEYEGSQYSLGSLQLNLDLLSVLRTRDVNAWEVRSLTLTDLTVTGVDAQTQVKRFELTGFRPSAPSPFEAELIQRAAEGDELPLKLDGRVVFEPESSTARFTETRFETTAATGVCDLDATYRGGDYPPDPPEALIPVSIWRSVDWQGQCRLDRLTLDDEDFANVTVSLTNNAGRSATDVHFPDFFGGEASITVEIDASTDPVRWRLVPDLKRADSEALLAWLDQRLKWIAAVALAGEITMTGNTEDELARSVRGRTRFDGGKGRIDITQIKQPLLRVATLFKDAERIAAWPDLWAYERFTGEWNIDGIHHALKIALDNLTATADGTYDPIADAVEMTLRLSFENDPELSGFDVHPVLRDLPVPLTCTGSLEAPKCTVTAEATRNLVAAVLTSEEGSELRETLDQKIEEEVPEQYREAARGLLDLLGESLKKPAKDN